MKGIDLENLLVSSGAILNGHFLLTSGRHSNRYIEKFRVLEDPDFLNKITYGMAEYYKNKNIDIVLGAAIGGILIAGGVGRHLGVKHIFSERINGKMELKRGFTLPKGSRVLIVEDIITTGGSVFELIKLAKENDAKIIGAINLVERSIEKIDFNINSITLLNLPNESWDQSNCPLCENNIPLTKRGRTGK